MDLLNLSVADLRRAAQIKEQIESLNGELASILTGSSSPAVIPAAKPAGGGRRTMSAEAKAKIAAAARARWAKIRAAKGTPAKAAPAATGKKRKMSAAGRARIAAAAKARWAKVRAAKLAKS